MVDFYNKFTCLISKQENVIAGRFFFFCKWNPTQAFDEVIHPNRQLNQGSKGLMSRNVPNESSRRSASIYSTTFLPL